MFRKLILCSLIVSSVQAYDFTKFDDFENAMGHVHSKFSFMATDYLRNKQDNLVFTEAFLQDGASLTLGKLVVSDLAQLPLDVKKNLLSNWARLWPVNLAWFGPEAGMYSPNYFNNFEEYLRIRNALYNEFLNPITTFFSSNQAYFKNLVYLEEFNRGALAVKDIDLLGQSFDDKENAVRKALGTPSPVPVSASVEERKSAGNFLNVQRIRNDDVSPQLYGFNAALGFDSVVPAEQFGLSWYPNFQNYYRSAGSQSAEFKPSVSNHESDNNMFVLKGNPAIFRSYWPQEVQEYVQPRVVAHRSGLLTIREYQDDQIDFYIILQKTSLSSRIILDAKYQLRLKRDNVLEQRLKNGLSNRDPLEVQISSLSSGLSFVPFNLAEISGGVMRAIDPGYQGYIGLDVQGNNLPNFWSVVRCPKTGRAVVTWNIFLDAAKFDMGSYVNGRNRDLRSLLYGNPMAGIQAPQTVEQLLMVLNSALPQKHTNWATVYQNLQKFVGYIPASDTKG